MDKNWCSEKLSDLQERQTRLHTLSDIHQKLKEHHPIEVEVTANILTSSEIFDCLDASERSECIRLASDILTTCISSLELDRSSSALLLEPALKHENPKIQSLALDGIIRFLDKNPNVTTLEPIVILLIISCLESDETEVGMPAVKILSKTLKTQYDKPKVMDKLLQLVECKDVVKFRMYEIIVNLAKSSSDILEKHQATLNMLLMELYNPDVLIQLNALELMISLSEEHHGLIYMEDHQLFEDLNQRVVQIQKDAIEGLLLPGFLRFFGKIAYHQPNRIICGYPRMAQCLFNCLTSYDLHIIPVALDALANIASTVEGKVVLNMQYSKTMKQIFEGLQSYIESVPTDLKKRAFNALELIYKPDMDIFLEIEDITQKWCQYFTGTDDLQYLLEFSRNPFPDIKVAALNLVKAICEYQWGVLAFKKTAGFLEYVLSREIEFDKEARYAKYEIVTILAASDIYDERILMQMRKFLLEGVYYLEGVVDIAVEKK